MILQFYIKNIFHKNHKSYFTVSQFYYIMLSIADNWCN